MTDVVQQRAQKHNDWWMALAARINSDLPGALATIEGDGQAMIEEIRAAGGYPWQRTFDTVLSAYRTACRHREGLDFIARYHDFPTSRGTVIETFLGNLLTALRNQKRIEQAREVMALMKSEQCVAAFPEAERHGYLHRLRFEQAAFDLVAGNVGAAIAFYEEQLRGYDADPAMLVKLASAYVAAGRVEDALTRLERAYSLAIVYREYVESWPEWASFVTSAPYQAKFPAVKFPEEPLLAAAWKSAADDPFRTWKRLEARKGELSDTVGRLAVQLFCLSRICSDLDEHGEDNLWEYGGGDITPAEFVARRDAVAAELRALGPGEIPFWKHVGWSP